MFNNPFNELIFTNPKLSAVKLFFFWGGCEHFTAQMAANSNLALILGHPLQINASHWSFSTMRWNSAEEEEKEEEETEE